MPLKEPSKDTCQGQTIQERVSQATGFKFPVYEETKEIADVLENADDKTPTETEHETKETQPLDIQEVLDTEKNPHKQPKGLYLNRYYTVMEIGKLLAANKEPILQAVEQNLQENNTFGAAIKMPSKYLDDEKFMKMLLEKIHNDMLNETKEKFEYYGDFDHQKKLADTELSERLEQYFTHTVEKSLSPRSRTRLEKNKALDTLKEYIVEKKISHTVLPIVLNILDKIQGVSEGAFIKFCVTANREKFTEFINNVDPDKFIALLNGINIDNLILLLGRVNIDKFIELFNNVNIDNLIDLLNGVHSYRFINLLRGVNIDKFTELLNDVNIDDLIELLNGVDTDNFIELLNDVNIDNFIELFNNVNIDNLILLLDHVNIINFTELLNGVNIDNFTELLNDENIGKFIIFFNIAYQDQFIEFIDTVNKENFVRLLNGCYSWTLRRTFTGLDLANLQGKINSKDYDSQRFIAFLNKHKRLPKYFLGRYY